MARSDRDKLFELVKKQRDESVEITRTRAKNLLDWSDAKIDAALDVNRDRLEIKTWGYLDLRETRRPPRLYAEERDLWAPICATLNNDDCAWLKRKKFSKVYPINTASRRKEISSQHGKWSNPDTTIIFYHRFKYLKNESLEVITFEVKHAGKQLDVTAVFEALAHRRAATMSYVFVYYQPDAKPDDELLQVLITEASRHGIGIILASNIEDSSEWEELLTAKRVETNLYDIESFFDAKLDEDEKERIRSLT